MKIDEIFNEMLYQQIDKSQWQNKYRTKKTEKKIYS